MMSAAQKFPPLEILITTREIIIRAVRGQVGGEVDIDNVDANINTLYFAFPSVSLPLVNSNRKKKEHTLSGKSQTC